MKCGNLGPLTKVAVLSFYVQSQRPQQQLPLAACALRTGSFVTCMGVSIGVSRELSCVMETLTVGMEATKEPRCAVSIETKR